MRCHGCGSSTIVRGLDEYELTHAKGYGEAGELREVLGWYEAQGWLDLKREVTPNFRRQVGPLCLTIRKLWLSIITGVRGSKKDITISCQLECADELKTDKRLRKRDDCKKLSVA